jgi:hypothetical protein
VKLSGGSDGGGDEAVPSVALDEVDDYFGVRLGPKAMPLAGQLPA